MDFSHPLEEGGDFISIGAAGQLCKELSTGEGSNDGDTLLLPSCLGDHHLARSLPHS